MFYTVFKKIFLQKICPDTENLVTKKAVFIIYKVFLARSHVPAYVFR